MVTNESFRDGKGFSEYLVHQKIDEFTGSLIRNQLKGRDINFVLTVETTKNPDDRLYEVTLISE